MKMRGWNLAVWVVLMAELFAFGSGSMADWGTGIFISVCALIWFALRSSQRWAKAMEDFRKSNPLSPGVYQVALLLLTIVAVVTPYLTGDIVYPLFIAVALMWMRD